VIPRAQLTLAHLLWPDARWDEIERFALSFDGQARIGQRLGELAKKHFDHRTLPDSLDCAAASSCCSAVGGTWANGPMSARCSTAGCCSSVFATRCFTRRSRRTIA
jgi:hypothetical protein